MPEAYDPEIVSSLAPETLQALVDSGNPVVHVITISGGSAGEALALAIIGFASRIPVALMLGWLFLRRESIWASIGLHAAFNGILLILGEAALRNGI